MSGGGRSMTAKFREEPLVPLGVLATIGAFLYASQGIYRNNTKMTQWGMRGRVVMQGLTLLALVGYGVYGAAGVVRERRQDARQIDWEKLERQAKEAEAAAASSAPPSHPDPAIAMLIDKARERKAKSVFASDDDAAKK
ncbi:Respiratory supercomplex factor 1, mitochondrial [Coemansia nantahalensis]|uniref:Respiratory supercomplex factor 1, mitochondrial n=2 Tax=Coemansia TaxID=4863 RepID=A0ACC1L8T5_9FUNG|nr:Respiratory supercomplex factor 1, mitochondrial [Coemansia nantahalensis]KAJ2771095.1 Respiratory supercomplex factor 1, mitochondrial [Coemansia nantahalensis]KAJ2803157.1 Respiratory supercomplex factor 1, mitochondrial [Coemansia helicoidea]